MFGLGAQLLDPKSDDGLGLNLAEVDNSMSQSSTFLPIHKSQNDVQQPYDEEKVDDEEKDNSCPSPPVAADNVIKSFPKLLLITVAETPKEDYELFGRQARRVAAGRGRRHPRRGVHPIPKIHDGARGVERHAEPGVAVRRGHLGGQPGPGRLGDVPRAGDGVPRVVRQLEPAEALPEENEEVHVGQYAVDERNTGISFL